MAAYGDFTVTASGSSALEGLRISFNATTTAVTSPSNTKIGYISFVTGTATGVASVGRVIFNASAIWALGGGDAYVDAVYSASGGTPGITGGVLYVTPGASFQAIDTSGFTFNGTSIVIQNSANACAIAYSVSSSNAPNLTVNTTQTVDISASAVKNLTFNAGTLSTVPSYLYVYGDLYFGASVTISATSCIFKVQKVVGSPTVTRSVEMHPTVSSSYGNTYGIEVSAGADTIQFVGTNFCSSTNPWGYIIASTPTTFTATTVYSEWISSSSTISVSGVTTLYSSHIDLGVSATLGSCAFHLKQFTRATYACAFYGSGLSYASLTLDSNVANSVYGNNTFGNLTCSTALGAGSGKSLKFDDGSTQTVTGTFTLSGGSASDSVSLTTINGTSAATISKASGTVNASYSTISYSNATGGATFKAPLLTNTDGGNNTGWVFSGGATGNFFSFF